MECSCYPLLVAVLQTIGHMFPHRQKVEEETLSPRGGLLGVLQMGIPPGEESKKRFALNLSLRKGFMPIVRRKAMSTGYWEAQDRLNRIAASNHHRKEREEEEEKQRKRRRKELEEATQMRIIPVVKPFCSESCRDSYEYIYTRAPEPTTCHDYGASASGSRRRSRSAGGFGTLLMLVALGMLGVWAYNESYAVKSPTLPPTTFGSFVMNWFSPPRYEGEQLNGKWHGRGKLVFHNGETYEGQFEQGKACGRGTYTWSDKSYYTGSWRDNKRAGHGTQFFSQSAWWSSYDGSFSDDKIEGDGTLQGGTRRYSGSFKSGKAEGNGTLTLYNELTYQGSWKDGRFHGAGKFFGSGGRVMEGEFSKGWFDGLRKWRETQATTQR